MLRSPSQIELALPYPPSANRIWRRSGKRIHRSPQYVRWLERAGWQVISQRQGCIHGPYNISIAAVRPDKRKRDLGNLEKSISDLLVSIGTVEDDQLANEISIRWVTSVPPITVTLTEATTKATQDTLPPIGAIVARVLERISPHRKQDGGRP